MGQAYTLTSWVICRSLIQTSNATKLDLHMCLASQDLDYKPHVDWPRINLNKELALAMTLQIAGCTLYNEVHVLAIFGPYKENQ